MSKFQSYRSVTMTYDKKPLRRRFVISLLDSKTFMPRSALSRQHIARRSAGIAGTHGMRAADVANAELERRFTQTVRPFLTRYCIGCHGGETPAAQFDLRPYSTMACRGPRLSSLGPGAGETDRQRDAAEAAAAAARRTPASR